MVRLRVRQWVLRLRVLLDLLLVVLLLLLLKYRRLRLVYRYRSRLARRCERVVDGHRGRRRLNIRGGDYRGRLHAILLGIDGRAAMHRQRALTGVDLLLEGRPEREKVKHVTRGLLGFWCGGQRGELRVLICGLQLRCQGGGVDDRSRASGCGVVRLGV